MVEVLRQCFGLTISFYFLLCFVQSQTPVTSKMKSFSSAIKGGTITANVEYELFSYNSGPAVITEQWYTGCFTEETRIKIYIDGENTPSIDFYLLWGHGVGFTMNNENSNTPWSSKRISHNAADGGLFNTYRIPFGSSIKITATHPTTGIFWYIVRGVENYPIIFGDLILPISTRLKLYKNENVELTPLQFITIANVSNTAGALYQVFLQANSTDYNYLEACYRVKIDNDENYQFLSSGTEDFYLSAYYFDRGMYHDSNAGCTYLDNKGSMSAYKFFENDPVLFTTSMELVWRCGETQNDAQGCPNTYPSAMNNKNKNMLQNENVGNLKLANTMVTTYVWVYEYVLLD